MKELTPKEEELLNFIFEYMQDKYVQPTYREMAHHFSSDIKTIADRLEAMERKQVIRRTGKSRYIQILENKEIPTFLRTAINPNIFQRSLFDFFESPKEGIRLKRQKLRRLRKLIITLEAYDLLNKWGREFREDVQLPVPVPIDLVAKDLFNYDIEIQDLEDGIPGKLFEKEKLIVVSIKDSRQRQRFTIGHELGHLCLHKEGNVPLPSEAKEREADYFAVNLLMPPKPFSKIAIEFLQSNEGIQEVDLIIRLSEIFGVSKSAAEMRLREFRILSRDDLNSKKTGKQKVSWRVKGATGTT